MDDKGGKLDLSSAGPSAQGEATASDSFGKSYLGVHFACCEVYTRIYPNRDQTAYVGFCPRCARRVSFQIGAGGTDSRFFQAY